MSHPRQQAGFTLIEVLITMVIMSIGLLGMAGLQASSLRNNVSAYQRSQSTLMAYDMLDRIRANRLGLINGDYDSVSVSSAHTPTLPTCVTESGDAYTFNSCTSTNMASFDTYDWYKKLSTVLPSARATVSGSGEGSTFVITVMWDDKRTGATGTNCDPNNSSDLACFTLNTQL